jgi:hypothetical protein
MLVRLAGCALMGVAAVVLGGCADTHGVDVYNATGEIVTVEMLSHDAAGTMTVYSTATINRDATFTNRMESPVRGQALRARFMLEGQSMDDENWVMLNLPNKSTRFYQLEVVDGRLKAVVQKRGRPEAVTAPQ